MFTDWMIVRRIAAELNAELRNARVTGGGLTDDDRFVLELARSGPRRLLFDLFAPSPTIVLEPGATPAPPRAWTRPLIAAVRGMRIERLAARRGDRLIGIDLVRSSRFGVESRLRLAAELIPRFGNLLALQDDRIIAAAKEFSAAQNPRRPIEVGGPYAPPPLPPAHPDGPATSAAAEVLRRAPSDPAAASELRRLLTAGQPLLPRLVADSLIAQALRVPWADGDRLIEFVRDRGAVLLATTQGERQPLGDVFVYRRAGAIAQIHVVPLHQFDDLECSRAPALLPLLREDETNGRASVRQARDEQRRGRLAVTVQTRLGAAESELGRATERIADESTPDQLRRSGEALYAHGYEIPAHATQFVPPSLPDLTIELDPALDVAANAAHYFKRYRKRVAERAHLASTLAGLQARVAFLHQLSFDLESADRATVTEIETELAALGTARRGGAAKPANAPREVPIGADVRAFVGRSPRQNAELTFRRARPDDLWFHARGIPGAHVVLRIDGTRSPADDELRTAAELAAFHSRAREAPSVEVDYTERKYVRRQRDAPPGLVWYTNARTIRVAPRDRA